MGLWTWRPPVGMFPHVATAHLFPLRIWGCHAGRRLPSELTGSGWKQDTETHPRRKCTGLRPWLLPAPRSSARFGVLGAPAPITVGKRPGPGSASVLTCPAPWQPLQETPFLPSQVPPCAVFNFYPVVDKSETSPPPQILTPVPCDGFDPRCQWKHTPAHTQAVCNGTWGSGQSRGHGWG